MTNVAAAPFNYLGKQAIRVVTSKLEGIIVPEWGSNLIALNWLEGGIALLRTPENAAQYLEKPALYGTPVLFPPNRIEKGQFSFNGRTYSFPLNENGGINHIHGVLMNARWDLASIETNDHQAIVETIIHSEQHPEIINALPHRFTVRMQFIFEDSSVTQRFILENKDVEAIPWGLGYHTTFRFPLTEKGDLQQCSLQLQADRQWELNERLMPTGTLSPIPYQDELNHGMSLQGIQLDDVFQIAVGRANEAVLTDRSAGLQITYSCDEQFGQWVIYNSDGKSGFLCPEPYTWVTNAPNLSLPASLTGFRSLAAGASVTAESTISVRQL